MENKFKSEKNLFFPVLVSGNLTKSILIMMMITIVTVMMMILIMITRMKTVIMVIEALLKLEDESADPYR